MIGQFTIPGDVSIGLNDRLQWECADPRTLRIVKAMFPATDDERSPAAGTPGHRLLHRAAEFFHAGEPMLFTRPAPTSPGQTD